ncbi:uncharacterized protein LOC132202502 isoform X3 [Neocloeon triangulifer]|uniref:uncharacterized protein LOC132202502 isoform X3 n=1 Tax=Neocloeon triangulifer TaxID=2078957 RepID=UPI00286F9592|nr:uncharacterized protein LOC132202502 isoform X3 [Neocloeon triangulifer]
MTSKQHTLHQHSFSQERRSPQQDVEPRGVIKRPFKLWDIWRNVRKALVVSTFEELVARGKEKLNVPPGEPVRLLLESDGTQVEDGEYFRTLPNNTVLLLLRPGERWHPAGVDVIRAAISAIPRIVCETIHSLELHDETPSWKIMDNKGRVTVVLHWDQRHQDKQAPKGVHTSVNRETGKKETLINDVYPSRYSPQITVINHDDVQSKYQRLVRQGSSSFEGAVHVHTPECANHLHQPRSGSPANGDAIECDFHCCALHEEGRKIQVHKSVATSPIQDPSGQSGMQDGRRTGALPKGTHVRFLDTTENQYHAPHNIISAGDSSESETENTVLEEEGTTSEKFLLLIDQLSVDQKRHLTIKDIGIILERLNSKILDVERLDRESESDDCYNWTIKATIRGEVLRELGVIYNGNYYAICEHPGYKEDEQRDEEIEEEEEEDRL